MGSSIAASIANVPFSGRMGVPVSKLERVVVAVDDLASASEDYARLLGRSPSEDGLFVLRNTTLQLVAREDAEVAGTIPETEGVAALVFREDGRETPEWLPLEETRGIPIGLSSDTPDEFLLAAEAAAPGTTADALDHVVISTADLDAALALYGDRLGLRLALDRSFEKRGIRILFFRVGGTTVEIVGALPDAQRPEGASDAYGSGSDRFGGLAWEVADVAGMRARLADSGFDVSEARGGHKPGTSVCTVRRPTHGVATLLKGPDSD